MPEEYWNLFARLAGPQPPEFDAKLLKKDGEPIKVGNEEESKAILADLERASWIVSSVTTKERKRNPSPPFITSKLQQTARFPVKKTMMLAQQLYEGGIEIPELTGGLITYMRTDSVRVADEAVVAVRDYIKATFGDDHLPEKPNVYKTKSDAQDAHEAIRPTDRCNTIRKRVRQALTPDQFALPIDLQPVRRLADARRPTSRHDGRYRRRAVRVPRQRHACRSSRLDGDLRPHTGRTGAEGAGRLAREGRRRKTRTACPASCRRWPKAIDST